MVKSNKQKYQPQAGDLVFAKVRGHRFWPARVESECPTGRKAPVGKFPVFFFGTYESAVVTAKDMVPYEENKEKHGTGMRLKDFATAMREIAETPDMTFNTRPEADPHPGLVSETICETKGPITSEGADAADHMPPVDNELVSQPVTKKRKRSEANVKSATKTKKKKKRVSSGSSEDIGHQESVPAEAEPVAPLPVSEPLEQKPEQRSSDKSEQKRIEKLKAKAERKEKKKAALKAEKMMKKRQERLNQLKSQPATEQMLRDVDAEIIESLSVTNRDVPRCLQAMNRLDLMAVTPALFLTYPNILVRKKADYLHHKYKFQMISDPSKLDPEIVKQIKAIRAKNSHSGAKSSPEHDSAERARHCSQSSAHPEPEQPPADSCNSNSTANTAAVLPSDSVPAASSSPPHVTARSEVDEKTDEKQDSVVVDSEQRSESGIATADGTSDEAVLPVVTAVMEKITDAVIAAEMSSSDVAVPLMVEFSADLAANGLAVE